MFSFEELSLNQRKQRTPSLLIFNAQDFYLKFIVSPSKSYVLEAKNSIPSYALKKLWYNYVNSLDVLTIWKGE